MMFLAKIVACLLLWSGSAAEEVTPAGVSCVDLTLTGNGAADTTTAGNCCKGGGPSVSFSEGITCPDGVQGTVVNGEFVPDATSPSATPPASSTSITTTTSSVSTTSGETGCSVVTVACGTKCTPDPTSTCKDGQCLDLFGAAISCVEPASAGSTTTATSVGGSTSNVSNNNQVGFGTDINQGDVTTPSIDVGETDEAITASDAFYVKASATAMSLVILAVVGIN